MRSCSKSFTKPAAEKELGGRRSARDSLSDFIASLLPNLTPARHHRALLAKLEAVSRRQIRRLMVFMPPGHAKSTYASVLFSPWFLGNHPVSSIIATSHTASLADRFGRKDRNIVAGNGFPRVLGFRPIAGRD